MKRRRIGVADIGGTHARFALASIENGTVAALDEPIKLHTSEHASLQIAWEEFGRRKGVELPKELALSFAGPIGGEMLKLTNNAWVIRPGLMRERLGVERFTIVNDFGAVAYAVANLSDEHFRHLYGPEGPLPERGVISVLGPGTGLGVAGLLRDGGTYHVIETEGGHIDFAPLDTLEEKILSQLRKSFRRVSVERIVSGRGLLNVYEALSALENRPVTIHDEKELWTAAMEGTDTLAVTALDRFCLTFGAVAGDIALAQGGKAVVIAGGLGQRLAEYLPRSGFRDRFIAKGRYERMMDEIPLKLITHPEPGLYGAAAAFAKEHA